MQKEGINKSAFIKGSEVGGGVAVPLDFRSRGCRSFEVDIVREGERETEKSKVVEL